MTPYTIDNAILFLKARRDELNRQNADLMSRYAECETILEYFEGMKKNNES